MRSARDNKTEPESRTPDRTNRPPRVPMNLGQKLVAEEREGYQRYWAVDRKGMIEQMLAAWWTHVKDNRGNNITAVAGNGETHYLMEIEKQYYDEDMAKQQQMVNDAVTDRVTLGPGEYVPKGYDSVLTREILS